MTPSWAAPHMRTSGMANTVGRIKPRIPVPAVMLTSGMRQPAITPVNWEAEQRYRHQRSQYTITYHKAMLRDLQGKVEFVGASTYCGVCREPTDRCPYVET